MEVLIPWSSLLLLLIRLGGDLAVHLDVHAAVVVLGGSPSISTLFGHGGGHAVREERVGHSDQIS